MARKAFGESIVNDKYGMPIYAATQGQFELVQAIEEFDIVSPLSQDQIDDVSYYAKRTPLHSRIDVNKTLAEQFDLIRVCDPKRYPAFFEYLGTKYILKLEKNCEQ